MLLCMAGRSGDDEGRNKVLPPAGDADPTVTATQARRLRAGRAPHEDALGRPSSPHEDALGRPSSPHEDALGRPSSPHEDALGRPSSPHGPGRQVEAYPPLLTPMQGVPIPAGSMQGPYTQLTAQEAPPSRPFLRTPPAQLPGPASFRTPSPFSFQDRRTPSPAFGVATTQSYGGSVLTPAHGVPAAGPSSAHGMPAAGPSSAHGVPAAGPSSAHGMPAAGPSSAHGWPGVGPSSAHGMPAAGLHGAAGRSSAHGMPAAGSSVGGISTALPSPRAVPTPTAPQALRRTAWAKAVGRFYKAFTRAVVGAQRYPADSPVLAEYISQARTLLEELLRQQSPLTLTLRGTALWSGAEAICDESEDEARLLTTLSREGLDQLTFLSGMTAAELHSLISVLAGLTGRERPGDISTRLWRLDAAHFQYTVNDAFDPMAPTGTALTAEHDQYRQLVFHVTDAMTLGEPPAEALAGWAPPVPLPWVDVLDSELSERRSELDRQDELGPLMARASILLLGALGAESEPSAETPAWRLLTELLRAVVGHGHFTDAIALIDRMDEYGRRASSANIRRMVDGVRGWLGTDDMVRVVLNTMEQTSDPAKLKAAVDYLQRVGAHADGSLWRLASGLRTDLGRSHVAELLVGAAERDTGATFKNLAELNQLMVIDVAARAEHRRTAVADLLWWYALEHRDGAVRAAATKLLRRRDGQVAEAALLAKLDDPDVQVRIAALDAIGRRPRQGLLNRVQSYFKLDNLERINDAELGMAMVAFARILGNRSAPQLAHILTEGHRLRLGTKSVDVQVKAAQVLGAIADPAAEKALQSGIHARNVRIKQACQRALEGEFAQSIKAEIPPDIDLSPKPPIRSSAPVETSTGRREKEVGGRRLARGIVGLPAKGGGDP